MGLTRTTYTSLLLGCTALVAGCSGEPSQAEIRRATESLLARADDDRVAQLLPDRPAGRMVELLHLQKLRCQKATNDEDFLCDIRMEVSTFGLHQQHTARVRMVRDGHDWLARDL